MSKPLISIIGVVVVILVGGVIFLGTYKLPAPTQQVELQIPNDRLSLQ
ncbi:hypothetical protein [Dongia rigui]|uniref:Uncharacterized protein n=1 Tax=Dongia rigui TaxID=940149 RepID=A0ABU5DZS5_9PROT|nr:hypothetical protein [Dongia rigui]MDY0872775.1 hypothetical protein [Dongia rigui]